jgi:protein N-terminal methyltransferase
MSKKKESSERMEGECEDVKERQTITRDYYSSRPNTFETMLGGFTQVHDADIQESNQLLQALFKQYNGKLGSSYCLELGCGIGRVTKNLLSRFFDRIDINDLLEEYCQQTRALFEDEEDKIDRAFACSIGELQLDHFPKYDLIWAQCKFVFYNS